MVRVKICGITNERDLSASVDAGADAVGFISGFEASPRNLSLRDAEALISGVPPLMHSVLVTNTETLMRNIERVSQIAPGAVQLYGDLSGLESRLRGLKMTLIRPVLVGSPDGPAAVDDLGLFDAVLTDTYAKGIFGGTGKTSDWEACRRIERDIAPLPMILSGGLNPENVTKAIEAVHPYAVDTSSGVEASPGVKDPVKVKEFVRRAKEGGRPER